MKFIIDIKLLGLLFGLIFLASCTVVPKASSHDTEKAKKLMPSEENALVYIIRSTGFGSAIKMNISCNGKIIGATGAKQFIYNLIPPGHYTFASLAENTHELPLEIEAGKTYFIQQKVTWGVIQARTELVRVSPNEGKTKLGVCALSSQRFEY